MDHKKYLEKGMAAKERRERKKRFFVFFAFFWSYSLLFSEILCRF